MRPWISGLLAVLVAVGLVFSPAVSPAQADSSASTRKIVSQATATYPALAHQMRLSGTVRLEVVVAPNGSVKSVGVTGGHPLLVQAAVDAVRKFKWEPTPHESKESVLFNFNPN